MSGSYSTATKVADQESGGKYAVLPSSPPPRRGPNGEIIPDVNEKDVIAKAVEAAKLATELHHAEERKRLAQEAKARALAEQQRAADAVLQEQRNLHESGYHGLLQTAEAAAERIKLLQGRIDEAGDDWQKSYLVHGYQQEIQNLKSHRASLLQQAQVAAQRFNATPTRAPNQITDPVERLASALSPKSAEWVRNHPAAARDVNRLQAVAQHAQYQLGLVPDSPEFFAHVEREMGLRPSPSAHFANSVTRRNAGHQSWVSSADARNDPAATLTAAELEAARDSGCDPAEYARQKARLQAEGRM